MHTILLRHNITTYQLRHVCRDIVIGIATRYGLDGTGIESQRGARFSAPVQTGPGTHLYSYTMGPGFLSRG